MSNKKNILAFPDPTSIEEEAGVWVARMDSQELSASDQKKLQEWVGQSSFHRETLERMAQVWSGCGVLENLNLIEPMPEPPRVVFGARPRLAWIGGAIAASILALCAVLVLAKTANWRQSTQVAVLTTDVGEQETINLSDGSVVTLNTDTAIEVDFTDQSRTIQLLRGEAHFEVAKDLNRAFWVDAGNGAVKALGTAFTVYRRPDNIEITVSEGIVELLMRNKMPAQAVPREDQVTQTFSSIAALTMNENAIFTDKVEQIEKLSHATVERKLMWREGVVGFAGEPLSVVIDEVSRYTKLEILIADEELKDIPIGGFFRVGDVDGLFEALETVFDVKVTRVSASRVTLSRAV